MATHTIGTGGDFSTPQAWEDDIPATLTEQRIGQCKNQEFSGSPAISFSAHTTTSSFNIILEAESGASFKDAGVRNNPLRYSSSGARFTASSTYAFPIVVSSVTIGHLIIRDLMVFKSAGNFAGCIDIQVLTTTESQLKDLICENLSPNGYVIQSLLSSGNLRMDNVVAIQRATSGDGIKARGSGGTTTLNGCTVVRPSNVTPAGIGIQDQYGATFVFSTVIAGFSTDCASGWDSSSDYNATTFSDAASGLPDPATDHNVYDLTYDTALFVQPSDAGGNHDFRTLTGSALENAGLLDATNAPEDISGETRNDPPEIGAWELTPPPPPTEPRFLNPLQSNLSWR